MPGMRRSHRATSKRSAAASRSASRPFAATMTLLAASRARRTTSTTAGSSSTSSTARPWGRAGGGAGAVGATAAAWGCVGPARTGSTIRKAAPPPGRSATPRVPPWALTIPWQMLRPSPVPSPAGLVVKKGSKIRSAMAGATPGPLSATTRVRAGPPSAAARAVRTSITRGGSTCLRACWALTIRLSSTWLSWPPSPQLKGRSGSRLRRTSIWSRPRSPPFRVRVCSTSRFRLTWAAPCRCWRAKSCRLRTIERTRSAPRRSWANIALGSSPSSPAARKSA